MCVERVCVRGELCVGVWCVVRGCVGALRAGCVGAKSGVHRACWCVCGARVGAVCVWALVFIYFLQFFFVFFFFGFLFSFGFSFSVLSFSSFFLVFCF